MGIWDLGNSGSLEYGIFGIWDVEILGPWEFGTFGIWNLGNLGSWEFGILGIWDFGNLEPINFSMISLSWKDLAKIFLCRIVWILRDYVYLLDIHKKSSPRHIFPLKIVFFV